MKQYSIILNQINVYLAPIFYKKCANTVSSGYPNQMHKDDTTKSQSGQNREFLCEAVNRGLNNVSFLGVYFF